MRDSDDDKTKRQPVVNQPAVNKHAESEQATRIVPAKNKITAASHNEDKTRITGHSQQQTPADDKTRILGNTSKYNTKSSSKEIVSDRTRFRAANVAPGNDKAATVNENTGGSEVQPVQIEESAHGTLKNRFILEKVLGVGGMGIVYKAKDRLKVEAQDSDPYVAIKVLSEEFKTHPEAFISLQRESRKSQRIAHPNIVNVHDFDRDGATVFMTMEFLDGSPLDQLIRQYKSTGLPTDDAWVIVKGMSAALSYSHAEKIIHSDFKPGNVFVTKKGLAKVFDFGIARAVAKVEHLDDNPEDENDVIYFLQFLIESLSKDDETSPLGVSVMSADVIRFMSDYYLWMTFTPSTLISDRREGTERKPLKLDLDLTGVLGHMTIGLMHRQHHLWFK